MKTAQESDKIMHI